MRTKPLYILLAFATNYEMILVTRALSGIGSGCAFVLTPVFVSEIAEKDIRGLLGGVLNATLNGGMLITKLIVSFVDFKYQNYVFIAMSIPFFIGFPFVHDSPEYLLLRGREKTAEKALKFFRGIAEDDLLPPEVQEEFDILKNSPTLKNQTEKLTINDFTPRPTRKAVAICTVLYCGKVISGVPLVVVFLGIIVKNLGSNMNPEIAASISLFIGIPATLIFFGVVERMGRRLLLLVSIAITALSYIPLVLIAHFNEQWNVSEVWGIFFVGLIIFAGTPGLVALPLQLAAELLPPKVRSIVCSVMYMCLWFLMFLFTHFFLILVENIGLDTVLLTYFSWCVFEGLIPWKFLPETRGKTYDEIAKAL
ncbi:hypothetical protein DMENIID0001_054360 [Sergentomyia squamirostris]